MGKKSSDEDKTTLAEAFINFQLQVKRKEIHECQEEVSQLETKKQRHTELREQLKEEQLGHIKVLRKQAKEQESKLEQREVVNKEQVEQALQQNLELVRSQEKELAELRAEVIRLEEEVLVLQAERHIRQEYKMAGSQEHQQQIQHLEAELAQMQKGFQEMADNIQRSLDVTFNEIDKKTVHLIDDKKQLATELAIYTREVSITALAVQQLEEENLEHMGQLFERRLEDLQISRNVFLTQAAGLGPSDSTVQETIMKRFPPDGVSSSPVPPLHPASEAWRAQKQAKELERDETSGSCSEAAYRPTEDPLQDLSVLLYGSQTYLQQGDMHLGPLEMKLLTVVGQALPLHPVPSETPGSKGSSSAPEMLQAPEDWPLTARIIHKRFK
ncbi:coiled-coil domain-containing protein 83 isoform X3 [Oncorhynchus tshawytscha]|uniref:coiled-coil domain-containing protein 83 isoform X3 n=1 Tax=Oncorhynchus tshawytscha TaxID=74940 RepID=UPI001C3E6C7F|nr:coiled-coil domain-containing protein 83 isoform X3 [Oncorhynchus tshawytscha]